MAVIGQQLTSPESGWKRIENTDTKITFEGKWTNYSDASLSGGSSVYFNSTLTDGKIRFKFFGTKLRFIGYGNPSYNSAIRITIDGQSETFSSLSQSTIPQMLCYEKTGLSEGVHDVLIDCNGSTTYWHFDAIDIDDSGYLYGLIGSQLTTPDSGWKRYDGQSSQMKFLGNWVNASNAGYYNGTNIYSLDVNAKVSFNFIGTKLRIISYRDPSRGNVKISIDGIEENFSQNGTSQFQILTYEKSNLPNGLHKVELSFGTASFDLDAIDIDENGRLLHPDEGIISSFIYHDGGYKKFIEGVPEWKIISTNLPSENTFISDGMMDLTILDRKSTDSTQTMVDSGSLGSGKLFRGSLNLKKYIEITNVSVK